LKVFAKSLFFFRERDAAYIKTNISTVHLNLTVKTLIKTEITSKSLSLLFIFFLTSRKRCAFFRARSPASRNVKPPISPKQIEGRTPSFGKPQEVFVERKSVIGPNDLSPQPPTSALDVSHPDPRSRSSRPQHEQTQEAEEQHPQQGNGLLLIGRLAS